MKSWFSRFGATGKLCLELVVALNFFLVRDRMTGFTHDSGNTVFSARNTVIDKILMNFRCPVYAMAGGMQNANLVFQSPVFTASAALWPIKPGMDNRSGRL